MAITSFPLIWRRIGVRAFRDRELEHEFRGVFRSAGVRFFEIGVAMTGLAYFAFFLIYAVSGSEGFAQPQPLRVAMVVCLLSTAAVAHFAKPWVARHYEAICVVVIAIGIVCATIIASLSQRDESPYSRYWGVYSGAAFGTCVIY